MARRYRGKDVTEILGYKDIPKAIKTHVEAMTRGGGIPTPSRGAQTLTIIMDYSNFHTASLNNY